jgi:hypothetical protein
MLDAQGLGFMGTSQDIASCSDWTAFSSRGVVPLLIESKPSQIENKGSQKPH